MPNTQVFDNRAYISAGDAANLAGFTRDYVTKICRQGSVAARRIGLIWYVDRRSFEDFVSLTRTQMELRREALARERAQEYRSRANIPSYREHQSRAVNDEVGVVQILRSFLRPLALRSSSFSFLTSGVADKQRYSVQTFFRKNFSSSASFYITLGVVSLFTVSGAYVIATAQPNKFLATSYSDNVPIASRVAHSYESVSPANIVHADPLAEQAAAVSEAFRYVAAAPGASSVQPPEPIAVLVQFSGPNVAYGDVVSFDEVANAYTLARPSSITKQYGVVVEDPALLFKTDGLGTSVPLIRSGSALVNVTLENGPIAVNDPLTVSSISGKARRAKAGESVFAIAGESFSGEGGILLQGSDGKSVKSGTILANVNIGEGTPKIASAPIRCDSVQCTILTFVNPKFALAFSRYLLAGLIAVLSISFAFRSFMIDANNGVISMGRNPSASSSIRSLVFFNAALALIFAAAGLFAAITVLFAAI